jgi:DNA sulfur modification protein DndB
LGLLNMTASGYKSQVSVQLFEEFQMSKSNQLSTEPQSEPENYQPDCEAEFEPEQYRFGCTQGMQCGDYFWMMSLPFGTVAKLAEAFLNRGTPDDPLDISQRSLNPRRVKQISEYVIAGLSQPDGFYVLPTLTMTVDLPAGEIYEFLEFDGYSNIGMLVLPETASFWLPDAQQRSGAIARLVQQSPGLIQNESVGVMLIPDSGQRKRDAIFIDINQHSVKPNKSLISLLDTKDEYSNIAREVLLSVPICKGRTALEATNVSPRSSDLFTMNGLKDACRLLCQGYEGDRKNLAVRFWTACAKHHPEWKKVGRTKKIAELRNSSIAFNALTINALGMVGARLLERQDDATELLSNLGRIGWGIENVDWDGLIRFNGNIVKNSSTIRALADYIWQQLIWE